MATHPRISSCDNAQLLVEMEAFLESKHNPSVIVERVQEENKIEKEDSGKMENNSPQIDTEFDHLHNLQCEDEKQTRIPCDDLEAIKSEVGIGIMTDVIENLTPTQTLPPTLHEFNQMGFPRANTEIKRENQRNSNHLKDKPKVSRFKLERQRLKEQNLNEQFTGGTAVGATEKHASLGTRGKKENNSDLDGKVNDTIEDIWNRTKDIVQMSDELNLESETQQNKQKDEIARMMEEVDEENNKKIENMSEEEIAEMQEEIMRVLSPDLVEFFRKRGLDKLENEVNASGAESVGDKEDQGGLEKEKLQWTTPYDEKDSLPGLEGNSARFDFEGKPLSQEERLSLPMHLGLHHHGDQAIHAGYTISELIHLSRSTVAAQRTIALQTLASIIAVHHKNHPYYSSKSDFIQENGGYHLSLGCPIPSYPSCLSALPNTDSEIVQLIPVVLRVACDENKNRTVLTSAIQALFSLLVPSSDAISNRLWLSFVYRGHEIQALYPELDFVSITTDESQFDPDSLSDPLRLCASPLRAAIMHTNLLDRINYIIDCIRLTNQCAIDSLIMILMAAILTPNSTDSTQTLGDFLNMDLVCSIAKNFLENTELDSIEEPYPYAHPVITAAQFVRLVCTSSRLAAFSLLQRGVINSLKRYLVILIGDNESIADTAILDIFQDSDRGNHARLLEIANEVLVIWRITLTYGMDTESLSTLGQLSLSVLHLIKENTQVLCMEQSHSIITPTSRFVRGWLNVYDAACTNLADALNAEDQTNESTEMSTKSIIWPLLSSLRQPIIGVFQSCLECLDSFCSSERSQDCVCGTNSIHKSLYTVISGCLHTLSTYLFHLTKVNSSLIAVRVASEAMIISKDILGNSIVPASIETCITLFHSLIGKNIPNEIWKALVIASDYLCGVARMICAIIEAIDGDRDMQLVDYIKELERDSSMVWIFQTINALVSLPQVEINLSKDSPLSQSVLGNLSKASYFSLRTTWVTKAYTSALTETAYLFSHTCNLLPNLSQSDPYFAAHCIERVVFNPVLLEEMSNYHSIAVKNEIDTLDINELCREAISVYIEQLGGDAGLIHNASFCLARPLAIATLIKPISQSHPISAVPFYHWPPKSYIRQLSPRANDSRDEDQTQELDLGFWFALPQEWLWFPLFQELESDKWSKKLECTLRFIHFLNELHKKTDFVQADWLKIDKRLQVEAMMRIFVGLNRLLDYQNPQEREIGLLLGEFINDLKICPLDMIMHEQMKNKRSAFQVLQNSGKMWEAIVWRFVDSTLSWSFGDHLFSDILLLLMRIDISPIHVREYIMENLASNFALCKTIKKPNQEAEIDFRSWCDCESHKLAHGYSQILCAFLNASESSKRQPRQEIELSESPGLFIAAIALAYISTYLIQGSNMNQTLFQSDIITGVSWIKRQFLQDLQGRNEVAFLLVERLSKLLIDEHVHHNIHEKKINIWKQILSLFQLC